MLGRKQQVCRKERETLLSPQSRGVRLVCLLEHLLVRPPRPSQILDAGIDHLSSHHPVWREVRIRIEDVART